MASPTTSIESQAVPPIILLPGEMPILYEDDEEEDLGETNPHVDADEILHVCLKVHLRDRPAYQVFSNMNLYYPHPRVPEHKPMPYVSPDAMAVMPFHRLAEDLRSYQIGREGPPPVLAGEIMSERSAQQRDLGEKMVLYALLGVEEYILVDVTGRHLPERLLLKRLQANRAYRDERDPDGGITSRLGFRLIIDTDGRLRMLNAVTGQRYARPDEAEAEAQKRREAEEARRQAEEARRQAEEARRQAEEACRQAEAQRQQEQEARRLAEAQRQQEQEARRLAEAQRRHAQEARRQAEARIRELEAELARLRGTPPEGEKP